MADWSMEPWVPCNFQQADWSMEHAVWIPDLPVSCESDSSEMTCLEETFVHSSSTGQQLVQYAAAATPNCDDPISVLESIGKDLDSDYAQRKNKMYRYHASLRHLDERYTVPAIVSIGPYHHGLDRLKKAEKAKMAAVCACVEASNSSIPEMYDAVVDKALRGSFYDMETTAGIENQDFRHMMFIDACFLVQWMHSWSRRKEKEREKKVGAVLWLDDFLRLNRKTLHQDIMLLENQLPWVVVETLMKFTGFTRGDLSHLVRSLRQDLQVRRLYQDREVIHVSHNPPHLLGLLRFYMVGEREDDKDGKSEEVRADVTSISVSAIELDAIGITLIPSKEIELARMGLSDTELCLAPLALTYRRASLLVNMAAFEVAAEPRNEQLAVCNYLKLLGMLVHREEDVQELRSKNLLQGGGGLTDKEALCFFTSLQDLPVGTGYTRTIGEIEAYKKNRRTRVKFKVFWYKNKKIVYGSISAIAAISSILGVLISALQSK